MIDWAITKECNIDCVHCRGMGETELSREIVLKTAKEIPSLKPKWVIIEGGEPLMRPELFEILKIIRDGGIKVYLITNGTLLNKSVAEKLAALNVNLMISVDGADKESYEKTRRGANFEKLKEAVAIANEYNILDSCPVTIGKHNLEEIDKLFSFVKSIGYKKITILGIKPCKDYASYALSGKDYERMFFSIIENQKKHNMDLYVDEPFFKLFLNKHKINYTPNSQNGITVPDISRCIFGEYMFIETNGNIKPCTFAPVHEGNLNKKSLTEIWHDMQNSEFIKKIRDFSNREGECKECEHLHDCGGCRSRVFGLTKSWTMADPSCPMNLK